MQDTDTSNSPRQFLIMQTKAESTSMQPLPDQNFRFGVLALNGRHTLMALSLGKSIRHRDVATNLAKQESIKSR